MENKEIKKQYPTTLTNEQVELLHKTYAKKTNQASWSIQTGKALRYAVEQFIKGETNE